MFDEVIPGANTALNHMRSLGKNVFFVTNNSTKSRETLLQKALNLGFIAHKVTGLKYVRKGFFN